MASPAQIENDLIAQANRLERTGRDDLVKSLRRAAGCIRELERENRILATGCCVVEVRLAQ